MQHEVSQNNWKKIAGEAAVGYIEAGMVIGLGTGSTAAYLIQALGQRIQEGLKITGAVPTSRATEQLAHSLGIPITNLDVHPELDLAIDGADEIDSQLHLIKGGGGALLREKIVASASRRFIIIADIKKQVPILGKHFPLPIEVIPFALTPVKKHLEALGAAVQLRSHGGQTFITDNGNVILDCSFASGITDPVSLDAQIQRIVGVVETGLFLGMAEQAIIGGPGGITLIRRGGQG